MHEVLKLIKILDDRKVQFGGNWVGSWKNEGKFGDCWAKNGEINFSSKMGIFKLQNIMVFFGIKSRTVLVWTGKF